MQWKVRIAERKKIRNEKKRQMPTETSKEVDHETNPPGAVKERTKIKSVKIPARNADSATVEVTSAPDVADGREKGLNKSGGLPDRNFDDSQRVRPKKRQRREASGKDNSSLPEPHVGSSIKRKKGRPAPN
jgi:hypothetical protein